MESVIDAEAIALRTQVVEYWEYRGLLWHLVVKELKVRYRHSTLGVAWSLAQPLIPALILGIVFSDALTAGKGGVPYVLFLFAGLVPWSFLSGAIASASGVFVASGYILTKVYFPRAILPAAAVLAAGVELGVASIVLCGWAVAAGSPPRASWLWLPPLLLGTMLLAFFISIGFASLNVLYRDVRHALPFLLQVWMYATPVLYSTALFPERWRWLLGFNPMTCVVLGFRHAMFGTPVDPRLQLASVCSGVVAAVAGAATFLRLQDHLAEMV